MIRLLSEADAAEMWSLRREALEREPFSFGEAVEEHDRTTPELTAARLRDGKPDNFVVGVFLDGELAGMAGFFRGSGSKRRHRGTVWGVYLRPEARGAGHGSSMLRFLLDTARSLDGLEIVVLSVAETNAAALALYRSIGFQQYGREPAALKVMDIALTELLMRYEIQR
jgi:ribosomal protein S18 acetylase RimI-like enzyme